MKILFFGDSITDLSRNRDAKPGSLFAMGVGYPSIVNIELKRKNPNKYQVLNLGISGHRIVDLYARVKCDLWNHNPDVVGILIGINDIWHELGPSKNGVDIVRFEKMYSMLIEETLERLPNIKIALFEPFVLKGTCTEEKFEEFLKVKEYAQVVESLAKKYDLYFIPLQNKFDESAEKYGAETMLYDGVHTNVAGAVLIADSFLEVFYKEIDK